MGGTSAAYNGAVRVSNSMAGLLYFIIAAAAAFTLRRVAQVRRATLVALVLLPLLFTGRELATRRVFAALDLAFMSEPLVSVADRAGVTEVGAPIASDVYAQFVPWQEAVRFALAHHEWPLWNPFEFCGDVLAGAMQSAPYHPLHIIGLLLPLPDALTFVAAMLLFLAATSMFLFVRPLVASDLAALTGAAAWMFAPHVALFAGTAYALSLATMPLVLLGARKVARFPTLRNAALLTFSLVLTVFAGHPESTLHVVIVATAYFFVELEWHTLKAVPWRPIRTAFACGIAALLLTAIAVGPFVDAMTQTAEFRDRFAGSSQHAATAANALRAAVAAMLPGGGSYVGSVALLLAIAALIRRLGRTEVFFAIVFALSLLAGVRAPVVAYVFAHLPLFSISANEHLIWSAALALSALAAFGADAITKRKGVVVALVIAVPALTLITDPVVLLRVIVPLLLVVAALFIPTRRYSTAMILALLLIQRAGETTRFRASVPRRAFYPDFPGVELLRGDEPFRVVGQASTLTPNIATHYGLEDPRGYQAMTLARYADLVPAWSQSNGTWSNTVATLDSPLLSLMNVRYAIAVPNEQLPQGWTRLAQFDGYDIVENHGVLPRAFVPARVHCGVSRNEAIESVSRSPNPAGDAWLETGSSGVAENGPGVVHAHEAGTRLDMHAWMAKGGWVVVSQSAWRGWRVLIDGKRSRVVNADGAFIAFYVPAGEHHIKLAFRPASFVIGALISAAAVFCVAVGALARRRRFAKT